MSLLNLIRNAFKVARLLATDDSQDLQFATVKTLGTTRQISIIRPYGLMSHAPVDSMVFVANQMGYESNGIGMADDPQNRIHKNMAEGEVALGNYITGDNILFDEDGTTTIKNANSTIVADINGNITATNLNSTIEQAADGAITSTNLNSTVTQQANGDIEASNGLCELTMDDSDGTIVLGNTLGNITIDNHGIIRLNGIYLIANSNTGVVGTFDVDGNVATTGTVKNNGNNIGSIHTHYVPAAPGNSWPPP